MKKPSDSFSKASRSASDQGGASGIRSGAACFVAAPPPSIAEQARLARLAVALALLAPPPSRGRCAAKSAERRGSRRVEASRS